MGLVKTKELANGNVELEIIYGGKEAPFGGIDSSMPPQYINPLCVVEAQGFAVVNGQYIAVSFQPLAITINLPASNFTVPKLAGFGSFYTEAQGWQNFIVIKGDTSVDVNNNTVANVVLYVWPSANTATPTAKKLTFSQSITTNPATPATQQVLTSVVGTGTSGGCGYTLVSADGLTTENYNLGSTANRTTLITDLVNQITARPSVICTAAVNADTVSATLTTIAAGASANNVTGTGFFIQPLPPGGFKGAFVFSDEGFQGGQDSYTYPSGEVPYPISWVQVGESLYIGGPGTIILQYSNQIFSILSQFVGANVLRKFAGSLIALGVTPSPGTVLQNAEMMLAWSAAGNFSTWNPTDSSGNVTGAGFEELADIGDPLTGGFVNSSTIVMLRSQGVSYATATGNATLPFDINHVDLAPEGEGCQSALLSSQYGPVGFFVGNTNVFEFVQNAKPIGDKIGDYLFPQLTPAAGLTSIAAAAKATSAFLLNTEVPLFAVYVQNSAATYTFLYNPGNGTWTRLWLGLGPSIDSAYLDDFPVTTLGAAFLKQSQLVLGTGNSSTKTFKFFALTECIWNANAGMPIGYNSVLTFPNEEIEHGKDITIDGLYALMAGTAGQQVTFYIYDIAGNALGSFVFTFPAGSSYSQLAEYQIYFNTLGTFEGTTTVTGIAPQLQVLVHGNNASVQNQFRLAKASLFGSYDPSQRPI